MSNLVNSLTISTMTMSPIYALGWRKKRSNKVLLDFGDFLTSMLSWAEAARMYAKGTTLAVEILVDIVRHA